LSDSSMSTRLSLRVPDTHPRPEGLSTRHKQALARRDQILETAVELFAQKGFDGTSTKEIAVAAGISEGLIFHYFPSKSQLLAAVLQTQHGFLNDLRDLLRNAEDRPAREVLPEMAALWFRKLREQKAITLILLGTAQTDPNVGEALKRVIQNGVNLLSDYLCACAGRGELRPGLPTEASALMLFSSMIVFFIRYRDLPERKWQHAVDSFSEDMLTVWFEGMGAPPAP
jgi:AcrR family transcriptional regulator